METYHFKEPTSRSHPIETRMREIGCVSLAYLSSVRENCLFIIQNTFSESHMDAVGRVLLAYLCILAEMTRSCVWHDSWLIHVCDMTHPRVWHVWFMCVIWHILMSSNYTNYRCSYSWHDSFVWVTWHMHKRDMTHWWVWHGSVTCVPRRSHSYVRHKACTWHMNESHRTNEWVVSHIRMSHVTHMNESCHTYEWVMSRIRMSHVTHINVWHMSHIFIGESFVCVTWRVHTCDMTRSYMWHDSK